MEINLLAIDGLPARRFNDERSALKDALVEFFVHSKRSSRILGLLSTKRKPIGYKALVEKIHLDEKPGDAPSAIRAVLCLIQAAGLVNLTRHGFSLTEVGREVQHRIEPAPARTRTNRSVSADGRPFAAILSGDDRAVLRRLRKSSHTYP